MAEAVAIDHQLIKRLVNSWHKRAGVRSDYFDMGYNDYNPEIPDYPEIMLPFLNHPDFAKITSQQHQEILTWAWLTYNERVVVNEEYVANPVFAMIMQGVFPGADEHYIQQALQQCLIDEHFHSLLHISAVQKTRQLRSLQIKLNTSQSITYRKLLESQNETSDESEKKLLSLVWTIVAEISVNAYLELLSKDDSIQPMNRIVPWLHNRDEYAHSKILFEIIKIVYEKLSVKHKNFFVAALPKALYAYSAHDFSAWGSILQQVNVKNRDKIIRDCENDAKSTLLIRDFSGLKKLAKELDIIEKICFTFSQEQHFIPQ